MTIPKFIVDIDQITNGHIVFSGDSAKQISKVLRLNPGDIVIALDGYGNIFEAKITEIGGKSTSARVVKSSFLPEPLFKINLFQALPKNMKMDLIIQKTTEIGVDQIIPFVSERVIVKDSGGNLDKKLDRWRKISLEASRQSGRPYFPKINSIINWPELINYLEGRQNIYVFSESEQSKPVQQFIPPESDREYNLLIGPEGGFTDDEITALFNLNAQIVGLGRNILRTETAALVAVTLFKYVWEDNKS